MCPIFDSEHWLQPMATLTAAAPVLKILTVACTSLSVSFPPYAPSEITAAQAGFMCDFKKSMAANYYVEDNNRLVT